jgi:hypothetical protein
MVFKFPFTFQASSVIVVFWLVLVGSALRILSGGKGVAEMYKGFGTFAEPC